MKKHRTIVLLLSFAMIFITSVVFGQTAAAPTGEPIKIGGSTALTGIASESGKWVKAGYEWWAEDVNSRGGLLGRPVKLIIYDDESNPDKAVTYYERAISVDKVDLVFGGYPGPTNVALMPVVEKYKKVMVGQGGHGKSFDQGFTYSFGAPPLMGEWSYISTNSVFEMIPKDQWPKSAAILTMNNVIGMSATPTILKGLEDHGCKVVVNEIYNLPLSDATPLISKAKGRNAEFLIVQGFFDDTVMIVRAAKAQRYNPKLIWNIIGSRVPAWFKEMGADGEGVLANNWFPAGLPFPGNDRIIEGSKRKFNTPNPPDFFAIAYCWMYSLEVGVKGANSLDDTKIRDFLRSKPLDLPFGKNVVFDSKGLPPPFNYTIQTRGGKNEIIWPKEYATGQLMYPRPQWSK